MARDLILHIGINKTGSTAIQKVLAQRRAEILAQGMVYPRSPGYERHALLAVSSAPSFDRQDTRIYKFASPDAKIASFRADFKAEMSSLPGSVKRVIISAEQLSFVLKDEAGITNLRDMLTPYVDDISVVVYLRRPDQHLTSLYSEMIRWGDARPPGLANLNLPVAHGYDYETMLNRWAAVFGEAAIKPQIFERPPGGRFDAVEHFLDLCGLKLTIPAKKTANEALSLPAQLVLVEFARRISGSNKPSNVNSHRWRVLVEAASTLPGPSWRPTAQEAQAFVGRYARNLEAVRRRWFPERDSLFSTDFSDLSDEPMQLDPSALLDACARVSLALGDKVTAMDDEIAKEASNAAEKSGDSQRLHRNLSRRIELFPNNIEARVKLARLLIRDGDVSAAQLLIEKAVQIDPKHAEARALRAELAANQVTSPQAARA